MADDIKKVGLELTAEGAKEFKQSLKEITSSTKEAYSELKLAQSQYDKNTSATKKLADRQEYLKKVTEDYAKKEDLLKQQLEQMEKAENRDEEAIAKKRAEINQCEAKLNDYKKSLEDVTNQIESHSAQLKEWGGKLTEVGGKMSSVGDSMTKNVTAPIVAAGAASVAAWKEVDAGMDIVTTKTGATGEALSDMQDRAKNIAKTIPTDFESAGAAVGEVNTRFGVTGDQLEDLSSRFIKFAQINNTDVSGSIDNVQSLMAAWRVDTAETGNVLDLLTVAGQETGVSVDTLSQQLMSNKTALDDMGLSLDQSVDLLANCEKSGIDTSAMLTGMKKAMQNATKEGKTSAEAFKELENGIKYARTETQAAQLASELFGSKAGPAIAEACRDGRLSFDDLGYATEDFVGKMESTFNEVQDPLDKLQPTLNTLKETGADLVETAGPAIAEILGKIAEGAKALSEKWNSLDEGQKQMILKIVGLVAALGPVLSIGGRVVSGIGTMVSGIGSLMGAAGGLSGVMAALSGPAGIVIGVIAAVIAIGVALYENWDTICAWASDLKEKVVGAWNDLKEGVVSKVTDIKEKATEKWNQLKDKTQEIQDSIKSYIGDKLSAIKQAYDEHGGGIQGAAAAAMEGVKQYYSLGYDAINELTGGRLDDVVGKFREKMDTVKQKVHDVIEKIKGFFDFHITLPHINLPHFSIEPPGWKIGDLLHGSIPSLGISWYRKGYDELYSVKNPSLIGIGDGPRSDSEFITGEKHMLDMIAGVVDAKNGPVIEKMDAFMNMVAGYLLMLIDKNDTAPISGDRIAQALTPAVMKYMYEAVDRKR